MKLLLALCRIFLYNREADGLEARRIIGSQITWPEFIRLALYHRMVPVVYPLLKKNPSVPGGPLARLARRYETHKIAALAGAAELTRLTGLFRSRGIDVVCLKGVPLTLRLYDNLLDRHHGDIDLLGSPRDIKKVHSLLLEKGYQSNAPGQQGILTSGTFMKAFVCTHYHTNYKHRDKKIRLEFHFRLSYNPHFFPYCPKTIFDRRHTLACGGVDLASPPVLEENLYLFAHGANHMWFRLKWLMDIAKMLERVDVQWTKIYERAGELGLERTVAQGLHLSNMLFSSPLPAGLEKLAVPDRLSAKLIHSALREIAASIENSATKKKKFSHLRRKPYLTKLKKGLRYKMYHWREIYYLDANRPVLKLPPALFPLYYILNPFLWLYRKFILPLFHKKPAGANEDHDVKDICT